MGLREQKLTTILSAVNSTGAGNKLLVDDFRHINFVIATNGLGVGDSFTFKVQGSMQDTAPDFDAAKSITNMWDYIDCKDMENTADEDGDTGITIQDTDDVRQFSVNVDGLKWVTVNLTDITDANASGVATVIVKTYND